MSIELRDVSKAVLSGKIRRSVFKHLDFWMEDGERVAVLGVKGSGKSLLLSLICGAEQVDDGWFDRTSSVSWPIPDTSFLMKTLSIAANLRFFARLHGVDQDRYIREVAALGEIEHHLNEKLGECPGFVKSQLAFAMSMWFDFDVYIFDDKVITHPKPYQTRAIEILKERTEGRGLLLATKAPGQALEYCNTAFVLDQGRATYYTEMKAALKHYRSLAKDTAPDNEPEEEVEEDEDDADLV
jgi:capsular polysaccharide transport system ATP-binding protein